MALSKLVFSRFLSPLKGLIAAALTSAAVLQGCAPQPSVQELRFWTLQLSPRFDAYIENVIATWESRNPGIDVRWTDIPWGSVERKLLAAVFARTAPDVVNLNPGFAVKLAERDGLLALDELVSAEARQRYLPGAWKASTGPDGTFGIPWYLTSRITLVNRDLLAAAGYGHPPTRWEELPDFAAAVKQATGRYALFVSVAPDDSSEILESFVQMGVQLIDDRFRAAFDTPAGRRAFAFWSELYQQGLLPPEVISQGHRRAIELYQSGDLALLATSAAALTSIQTNAPRIAALTQPTLPLAGPQGSANMAVMNLVVPRQSLLPGKAVDFALFVTNAANQYDFAKASGTLPSEKAALAALKEDLTLQRQQSDKADTAQALSLAARALSLDVLDGARVLVPAHPGIKQLQSTIYKHLQEAMLGRATADAAVHAAAEEWNRYAEQTWP